MICDLRRMHGIGKQRDHLIDVRQGDRQAFPTEYDARRTVLPSHLHGNPLNSPNDVVVKSDGSVWFTDPPYGITSNYEGHTAEQELDGCHVYRVGPDGMLTVANNRSSV